MASASADESTTRFDSPDAAGYIGHIPRRKRVELCTECAAMVFCVAVQRIEAEE